MRRLNSRDVFAVVRIAKKIGIREFIEGFDWNKPKEEIGEEFIGVLLNLADEQTEQLVFKFLAGVLEMDPEEVATYDFIDLVKLIREWVGMIDTEAWRSFFGYVIDTLKKT